jgi:hypothetical protein
LSLITLLVGTPWTPNFGQILTKPAPSPKPTVVQPSPPPIPVGGTESGEIRKIVWKGATEVWKHYPIFGTGVETFAYSYYWHRPREHNDVSEWDFLYNKAHNEYLNFAATTGTVGLLAYLGIIGTFLIWSGKFLMSEQYVTSGLLSAALIAGYASILVSNFFGFSVVPVALFFFLFPAMAVVLISDRRPVISDQRIKKLTPWQWASITVVLLVAGYCLLVTFRFWYADTLFAKGEQLNKAKQYDEAFNLLQRVVNLRPGEPFYHDQLSLTAANLGLAEMAIAESDQTIKMNPYHLNFWKNRTRVFYTLAEIDEKYNQNALDSLLAATELAPTDAKVSYNLGLIYAYVGQDETTIKTLEKTIELKPNYGDARYALALFYEQKGRREEAKKQLEYILQNINPNYQLAIEKLKEL